jgi:hypothetical protein
VAPETGSRYTGRYFRRPERAGPVPPEHSSRRRFPCPCPLRRSRSASASRRGGSTTCRYFRPGGFFDYEVGGAQVEPNITILKARVPAPASPFEAYADGHYVRVDRRATTPVETF